VAFGLDSVTRGVVQEELQQLPKDWKKTLRTLREATKAAYDELDEEIVNSVDQATTPQLDYFLARSVYERLQVQGEKGILGGFVGQAGSWQKLVAAYERKGTHPPCCPRFRHGTEHQGTHRRCTEAELSKMAVRRCAVVQCRYMAWRCSPAARMAG
jgi:hypothetical protein